jgi:hypothetical protein
MIRLLHPWFGILTVSILLILAAGKSRAGDPAPPAPPSPPAPPACEPVCDADHVYLFLINGTDPCGWIHLAVLGKRLQDQGFCHTEYGELYHVYRFRDRIRCIHQQDACARFVLIGFSLGCNKVCQLAESVEEDGITIDLMVFLSGNHWLGGLPDDRPKNVCRVLNIRACGALKSLGWRDWAEDYQLPTWHFGTLLYPATLPLLTEALCDVAAGHIAPGATVPAPGPINGPLPGQHAPMEDHPATVAPATGASVPSPSALPPR